MYVYIYKLLGSAVDMYVIFALVKILQLFKDVYCYVPGLHVLLVVVIFFETTKLSRCDGLMCFFFFW